MPQLTEFPYLPDGDPRLVVGRLIAVCRAVPEGGEPFKAFRARLREADLFDRDRLGGLFRFLRISGDPIVPSPLMHRLAKADDETATQALADRLFEANPILFKIALERLAERVSPPNELYSFLDSFAYRGTPVPRRELHAWVAMARGLDVLKRIGVAIGLGERGEAMLERARKLDIEEYIEDDEAEPTPVVPGAVAGGGEGAPAGKAAAPGAPSAPSPRGGASDAVLRAAEALGSPLGKRPPVPVARFSTNDRFEDDVLAETAEQLAGWWSGGQAPRAGFAIDDFGIDGEAWMENAEEALYRVAVAAALVFRLDASRDAVLSAYRALDGAGLLSDLYYGTAPETLPDGVDARALMLSSLVARRCAEAPDLAATLEKQSSAAEAFAALEQALGRGLFRIELFWIMGGLAALGALRWDDLADYTALPTRVVRDTLFRLGFLASPYAHDLPGLAAAAAAAVRAGGAGHADELLTTFAAAAGCAYDCPHRKSCDFPCRERLG